MHGCTQGLGSSTWQSDRQNVGRLLCFRPQLRSPAARYLRALQQFAVQRRLLLVSQDLTLLGETGFHFVQFCPKALQLQ